MVSSTGRRKALSDGPAPADLRHAMAPEHLGYGRIVVEVIEEPVGRRLEGPGQPDGDAMVMQGPTPGPGWRRLRLPPLSWTYRDLIQRPQVFHRQVDAVRP